MSAVKGMKVIMKVCLPVEYPPITSFPAIANSLSILWANEDKIIPWISDHYIQLMIRPHNPSTQSDFYDQSDMDNYIIPAYSCPFISWMRNNQTTAHFTNFTDYIEHQIRHEYYLDACLDRYYLSCSQNFNKKHFIHQTFIYGFDSEKKQVFVSDFYDDGRYVRKIVSYDEINKAIENIDYFINLYRYEDFHYETNFDLLKLSIEDYINCRDSLKKFEFSCVSYNKEILYGIDFYDYIIDVFCEEEYIDKRPFHVLCDHKKVMKIRLEYLYKIGAFDNNVISELNARNDLLIKDSIILRNMVIKYNICRSGDLLQKIKEKCRILKRLDKDFSEDLLKCISK